MQHARQEAREEVNKMWLMLALCLTILVVAAIVFFSMHS